MTTQRPETVAYMGVSLDGYIAREDGGIDWLPEPPEGDDYGWSTFRATIDALLMGRGTFEKLVTFKAWPYGDLRLYVLSATLQEVPAFLEGKVEIVRGTPEHALSELEKRGHRRVYVDGGSVVQSFLRRGLLDELITTRIPVLIGQGVPLFGRLDADISFEHRGTEVLHGGLVKGTYRTRR